VTAIRFFAKLLLASIATAAFAQSEVELKRAFEGRQVRVKMNMPATHEGVDVRFRQNPAVDFPAYGNRLKNFGVSIPEGATATITMIKLKDKQIEVQLDGGGYGTIWDDNGSVTPRSVSKSSAERDLDRQIDRETDPNRRDQLRRQRDRLREMREREEWRARQEANRQEAINKARIEQKRLSAGSRFNIRYPDKYLKETIPTPEEIIAVLEPYIEFGPRLGANSFERSAGNPTPPVVSSPNVSNPGNLAGAAQRLKKGLTRGEVQSLLGRPTAERRSRQGDLDIDTDVWESRDQLIEVEYANDIVIRYRITAK
jgi:hypothetical protein